MGTKGDKMTNRSTETATLLLEKIASIDGITSKKMFGGYGIFHEGKMFGLVDSKGVAFLKSNESSLSVFGDEVPEKHSKMPYYKISETLFNDSSKLIPFTPKKQ